MIDYHSYTHNLSIQAEMGCEPWPLQYQCSALLTEPSIGVYYELITWPALGEHVIEIKFYENTLGICKSLLS